MMCKAFALTNLINKGRLMANCGYDRDQGDGAVADGLADVVAFGRPFISNPDPVVRFANVH